MWESPPALIRFLARSEERTTVLTTLVSGASTASTLRAETGIHPATLDRTLDELCGRQLVERAGPRYQVTPLGGVLVKGIRAMVDSIEVIQRLQDLPWRLSDTGTGVGSTGGATVEILAPTAPDPAAPARRFADLLHAAARVRLLAPVPVPAFLDTDESGRAERTCELVIPCAALESPRGGPVSGDGPASEDGPASGDGRNPQQFRDAHGSWNVTLFACDCDVPYLVGTVDDVAVVGLTDGEGAVRGYVETTDTALHTWAGTTVEAFRRDAGRVDVGVLTG